MIQKLKNLLKARTKEISPESLIAEDKPETELVYIDKNGREWVAYKERLAMPFKRLVAIETAGVYENFKVTEEKYEASLDKIIDSVNKGDLATIGAVAIHLKGLMKMRVEEETLLTVAAGFFLSKEEFEAEQKSGFNMAEQKRKIEYWKKTPDCLDFFLELALKRLKGFTNLSAEDTRKYLTRYQETLKNREEEYLKIFKPFLTDTTT